MKNFVINLDRQPEKYASFLKRNAGCGIAFERFSAADGSQMSNQDVMELRIVAPGTQFTKGAVGCAASHWRIWNWAVEKNECAVVFEDDAVIHHDINEWLESLLPPLGNWDFLMLGCNTDSVLDIEFVPCVRSTLMPDVELAPGMRSVMGFAPAYPDDRMLDAFQSSKTQVAALRLNCCFGTAGYVISPVGARKLLRLCFPMDNRVLSVPRIGNVRVTGIDGMMNSAYRLVEAYACFVPLVLPPNDKAMSTTYTHNMQTWG